jgi:hypothetical protein
VARRHSTRERVLTLLARERLVYNRKTREHERVSVTMARTAKELGVSVRTLRRWKNENVQPGAVSQRAAQRLKSIAASVAATTSAQLARDRQKHPRAMKITRAAVPLLPRGHRRELKEYGRDKRGNVKATGRTYESSWINYSVRGWRFAEVLALTWEAVKKKKIFQFIYSVPPGGRRIGYDHEQGGRVSKTTRSATSPVNPYDFTTQADLADFLSRYLDLEEGRLSRRMLYVAVDDNHAHRGREDDDDEEDDEGGE